ncbi:MAG TPA: GAF domain-containing protein [Acidimicrobiia bacterium]|nr:GAF domain-containing protein [Acidimicrobiia bacterium]
MTSEHAGPRALRKLVEAVLSISADLDLQAVLQRIIDAATDLVDARYGALGLLDETRTGLVQFVTTGLDDETYRAIGDLPRGHGILGLLILEPKPLRLPDLREHPDSYGFPPHHPPMRSFLGVPIVVRQEVFGNLYLTDKQGAEAFSDIDEELTVALAGAAAVAIENARLHARLSELVVLEDRERIAKDLHDTVIQRLFATGLSLQGTARLAATPEVATRIQDAVEDLDITVKHIRTVIFGLERAAARGTGLRDRVITLTREARGALGFLPDVTFEGAVDTLIDAEVARELLATLREALSNVARHAAATKVEVSVVAGKDVVLRVRDDGRGLAADGAGGGLGLRNMATRAEQLDGRFTARAEDSGGTLVEWAVPAS